jgi:hypothetical protein
VVEEFSIEALVDAWRRATDEMKTQAAARVEQAAAAAADRIASAYPVGPTGNLRAGVSAGVPRGYRVVEGTAIFTRTVVSRAPHAWIYEHGTGPRVDGTRKNADRGRSPARGPVFIPIAIDERARMNADLAEILAAAFASTGS